MKRRFKRFSDELALLLHRLFSSMKLMLSPGRGALLTYPFVQQPILYFLPTHYLVWFRGDSNAGVNDRILSQLLTEMDGAQVIRTITVILYTVYCIYSMSLLFFITKNEHDVYVCVLCPLLYFDDRDLNEWWLSQQRIDLICWMMHFCVQGGSIERYFMI